MSQIGTQLRLKVLTASHTVLGNSPPPTCQRSGAFRSTVYGPSIDEDLFVGMLKSITFLSDGVRSTIPAADGGEELAWFVGSDQAEHKQVGGCGCG
jgi:hypothetical protein